MNSDGTFCLGFKAGDTVVDPSKASAWWIKLAVFLTCQDTAFESRIWPSEIEVSHGRAGEIEVEAENVAEQLGLLEEYQLAVRENIGPIAEAVCRIRESTGRLINGRAACVCGRRHKKGWLRLRRECWRTNDLCLPIMEAERRLEEKKFWSALKGKKLCCGTMDDCPLKG